MFVQNKKTRVAGKPRHFIDAYLDELEKVGCLAGASPFSDAFDHFLLIPLFSV